MSVHETMHQCECGAYRYWPTGHEASMPPCARCAYAAGPRDEAKVAAFRAHIDQLNASALPTFLVHTDEGYCYENDSLFFFVPGHGFIRVEGRLIRQYRHNGASQDRERLVGDNMKLKAENKELLAENATLRRSLEKAARK